MPHVGLPRAYGQRCHYILFILWFVVLDVVCCSFVRMDCVTSLSFTIVNSDLCEESRNVRAFPFNLYHQIEVHDTYLPSRFNVGNVLNRDFDRMKSIIMWIRYSIGDYFRIQKQVSKYCKNIAEYIIFERLFSHSFSCVSRLTSIIIFWILISCVLYNPNFAFVWTPYRFSYMCTIYI